jgi:DNA-binding NtrC family response regulator
MGGAMNGTMASDSPTRPSGLTLLVVDDETSTCNLCRDIALQAGLTVHTAATTEQALDLLEQIPVDVIITDLKVPELGGLELLKNARANYPQTSVMVLTQYGTIETAVEATRLGAKDTSPSPSTSRNCEPSWIVCYATLNWTRKIASCASNCAPAPVLAG